MKIALIDLKESANGCNNKDKGGTFGIGASGEHPLVKLCVFLKEMHARTPLVYFGYMSSILKKGGHEVRFYASFPRDEEVCILTSSIIGYEEEVDFALKIRRAGRKVGFMGAFASVKPELFLQAADFVIKGEPEDAMMRLARRELPLSGVIESPLVQDLDALPFPDWDGFPVGRYSYYPSLKKKPLLPILSSRGCSFSCGYCPYKVMQAGGWRARSVENTLDEIEWLKEKFRVRSLIFRDIMFTRDVKRTAVIAEEMIRRGVNVEWSCETRTDCLNEDVLRLLYRAGLRAVHIGVESSRHDVMIRAGRVPIKETHQEKVIRLCERLGIKVIAFYILGFPSDTKESIRQTLDYAKHLNTLLAQFSILTPYPGTRFFDQIQSDILTFDWKKYNSHNPVFRVSNVTPEEVLDYKNRAYREYYFRWPWIVKNSLKFFFN